MPTYMLTESDRFLVAHALRERGHHLRELVEPLITPPLPEHVCEQYVCQANQAEELAVLVEQSDRMDIWPKDRRDDGLLPSTAEHVAGGIRAPANDKRR